MFRGKRALGRLPLLLSVFVLAAGGTGAQVRPVYDLGTAGLIQLLQRIRTTASVLHTGAHPDDEDSGLMARLARGDHARVTYLSLTRGDGGQNVIGPELFEALGIIRTEELLQARRLDGGGQLFTRAFDFGYSKTLEETVSFWNEDLILGDMVRAIRMFRPLVVISAFDSTSQDGHGHHQYAGYLTPVAFHQAGDPNRYPEHLVEGLRPWQPLKLYVRSRGDQPGEGVLLVPTGTWDRAIGRSYFEIAMEGRSQHKSQGMGTLELRGSRSSAVRLVETHVGTPKSETSVFDGMDTSLGGLPRVAGLPQGVLDDVLARAQKAADRALAELDPLAPEAILPALSEGLQAVREARAVLRNETSMDVEARYSADFLLGIKEEEFSEALRAAAGVVVDALADTDTVIPGGSARVDVSVFFPPSSPIEVDGVELHVPEGWHSEAAPPDAPEPSGRSRFTEDARERVAFTVKVAALAPVTQPYWLETPRRNEIFSWPDDAPKDLPFTPPLAEAHVALKIGGTSLVARKTIEHRYADPARGEIRRALSVVPPLSVSVKPDLLVVPTSPAPRTRRVAVRVENLAREDGSGTVRLQLPLGWSSRPASASYDLSGRGSATALFFDVEIPGDVERAGYSIEATATSGGQSYGREMRTVAYPHIQTHRHYVPARVNVQVLDLKVSAVRVGYIMGSGDEVPEAIRRLGLDVTLLDENALATGDLSRFDVIVAGIRASQVRPDFVANNGRLLDFMHRGGTLIVQYQRQDYVERSLTPYPAGMSASPTYSSYRVTDEKAPVEILRPDHAVFNFPNTIRSEDWDGWVQERSSYHLTDLDPRYAPLVEAGDPGEPPHNGGLVYAEVGKGKYVYAGYSFFRQLPAGVPGAYRLFANLLSLGGS